MVLVSRHFRAIHGGIQCRQWWHSADYPSYALFDGLSLADPVTPHSLAVTHGTLSASDAQNDTLSYGIQGVTPVDGIATQTNAFGTLRLDTATGDYSYTPDEAATNALHAGETIDQGFTVTVSDGVFTASQFLSVTITGANDNPTGTASAHLALGTQGVTYAIHSADLLAGFSDVDSPSLYVNGLSANHGSVSYVGGDWTLTPDAGYVGEVQLSYQVTDGEGGSTAGNQHFELVAAPQLNLPSQALGLKYGNALNLNVAGVSIASQTGAISYSATLMNGNPLPNWLHLDAQTGQLSGTPKSGDVGEVGLLVTATNSAGYSVQGQFHIAVSAFDLGQFQLAQGTGGSVAGSAGLDTACFYDATGSVNLSLVLTGSQNSGGAGWQTLVNIDNLIGREYADYLVGNASANSIDGGEGADWMGAGNGNDVYVVDDAGDQVVENSGEGTDTVMALISYTLPTNAEKLVLLGTANLNGTGNSLNNTLTGNDGDNVLNGGTGADAMAGGAGNDTYTVDNLLDVVTEAANQGIDTVIASISYTLTAHVENLTLSGTSAINAAGNGLDNQLIGNAGANKLNGLLGNDTLTGGNGADHFQFTTAPNAVTNFDLITDFVQGQDKIDLSKAVFTAFSDAATGAALSNGEIGNHLLYDANSGLLSYDADGSAGAGSAVPVVVLGVDNHPAALTGADFYLLA